VLGRDERAERGTERDLAGAYNSAFVSWKHVGARTSLIVDPPNGRIPPLTPLAQKIAAAEREYRLALLQATDACKAKAPICNGGTYDPMPSPRRAEPPPRYNTGGMKCNDGPEDSSLAERCLTGGLTGHAKLSFAVCGAARRSSGDGDTESRGHAVATGWPVRPHARPAEGRQGPQQQLVKRAALVRLCKTADSASGVNIAVNLIIAGACRCEAKPAILIISRNPR
jgi:hypothetical protein